MIRLQNEQRGMGKGVHLKEDLRMIEDHPLLSRSKRWFWYILDPVFLKI